MFPILHGRNRLITKGYYFPSRGTLCYASTSMYIIGYNSKAVIITIPTDIMLFEDDTAAELRFAISGFNLSLTSRIGIVLQSPSGRIISSPAAHFGGGVVAYDVEPGDLTESGSWKYQITIQFPGNKIYHLDVGKFRVKKNITTE